MSMQEKRSGDRICEADRAAAAAYEIAAVPKNYFYIFGRRYPCRDTLRHRVYAFAYAAQKKLASKWRVF